MDIQRIREEKALDAVILSAEEEILAASGIYAPKSVLVADEQGFLLIGPEGQEAPEGVRLREYTPAGFEKVEIAKENLWSAVRESVVGWKRIGGSKYTCPAVLFTDMGPGVTFTDLSGQIREAMMCKPEFFWDRYEQVKNLNVLAYERIRTGIRSGCTEQELHNAIKEVYTTHTGGQVLYTGDFISGLRTCGIEGPATGKVIEKGETVIVDALVAYEGVYCDTTRSYFCSEPSAQQRKAYEALVRMHEEVRPMLRPGTRAGDIYTYVNRRLKEEGYEGLVHHAGHGVGYQWYEAPYFIESCDMILKEDMLVALEPGIYLPEKFGLRLENNYRVTENGGTDMLGYTMRMEDFIID